MRPKKVIIVVDDNEQVLSCRCYLLETWGFRAIRFEDPSLALAHIQNSVPGSIDLLLTDLLMPQMDGNELIRRVKQLHPSLPCLCVSGTVIGFDRVTDADVFLPKGTNKPAEILAKVKIMVQRKRGPKPKEVVRANTHPAQAN